MMNTTILREYIRSLVVDMLSESSSSTSTIGDSLDDQVDRLINECEEDARKSLAESKIIAEAEADEGEAETKADEENAEHSKMSADEIDPAVFATGLIRVIENIENLVEFRDTVLNRARNFINNKYEKTAVQLVDEALDAKGFAAGRSKHDRQLDVPQPTYGRAGPVE